MKKLLFLIFCSFALEVAFLSEINLLKNPEFIEGDSLASDWLFESSAPETFEISRKKNYEGMPAVVEISSLGADASAYLSQWVPVESDCWYKASVKYKVVRGKVL